MKAQYITLLSGATAMACTSAPAKTDAQPTPTEVNGSKPNIILIYTDDHGYSDLSCQGIQSDIRTPNIDRLAMGGVRMTDGYVTAPQSSPSRGGVITGKYQTKFGLESNKDFQTPGGLDGFNKEKTIADRLREVGYATCMAGKWHLGPDDEIGQHGFDHYFMRNSGNPGFSNIDVHCNDKTPGGDDSGMYHLDACSEVAVSFIERYKDKPFFLYLAYRAPHTPLDAPQKYLSRFPGDMPEARRYALAMISAVDDGVGRILATLQKYNLDKNTIIFFIGDNGAPLKIYKVDNPKVATGWDGSLNEPLCGEKGMVSEGGIRTPYVVYWNGVIPGGQIYRKPVISLDVAATAVALSGAKDDPELDGVNLIPYLTGVNQGEPHKYLFWRWMGQAAVRSGNWKYIEAGDFRYLYDMATDKEETNNVIAQHPEVVEELHKELVAWSNTLTPPGLTGEITSAATRYFNHYMNGIPAPVPQKAAQAKSAAASKGRSMK